MHMVHKIFAMQHKKLIALFAWKLKCVDGRLLKAFFKAIKQKMDHSELLVNSCNYHFLIITN